MQWRIEDVNRVPMNQLPLSGAGTNLKVGDTGPAQKWGHRSGAKRRKKIFGRASPLFWL